jgi:hypothetical protein|tara:strand:+ start:92 stop:238 length:147 start_codon:yes stop_codon:yes gene_type:complete
MILAMLREKPVGFMGTDMLALSAHSHADKRQGEMYISCIERKIRTLWI